MRRPQPSGMHNNSAGGAGSLPGTDLRTGTKKMRRTLCLMVLSLVGCQGVVGPRERPPQALQVDDPRLSIPEQQRLGRDRLALPEQSTTIAPRAYSDFLGPHGR